MSDQPTPSQRQAIEAPLGPVLVLAGPGAGKTFCLTYRVKHLIDALGIAPARIMAATFTNKAAEEIAARLRKARGRGSVDITRGTLHGICLSILRELPERCGLRPGFGVADHQYQMGLLKRLRIHEKARAHALSRFGLYQLQGLPLGERGMEVFARYQERLRARNLVDFDDLVALTERLLRTDQAAAAELRARWDYLLVDEFQDLNPVQYGIVRRLAEAHRNLFGVGDEEQSIFAWAGSDPRIIARFQEDFEIRSPVVLDVNRRCSIEIFETARRLIGHNPRMFQKQIHATRQSGFGVEVRVFGTDEEEAGWLVDDIQADRAASGTSWGEFALLYRSHRLGQRLEQRLLAAGIPCRLAQGHALGDDKIVGWVVDSLHVIRCPDDPVHSEALAARALSPALRQEVRKSAARDKDLLTNLRSFAASRPKGDPERRLVWRLIYHLENLRGLARSQQSLSALIDELLIRPIGPGRNPLEEHFDDLTEPSLYPGANKLAAELERALAGRARVWVEERAGLEIPLLAMLRGSGITDARRLAPGESPAPEDVVVRPGGGISSGRPLRVFKALQLLQTRDLRSDFDGFVAFDIETSDFDVHSCEIVEIAAVRVRGGAPVESFHSLVGCAGPISPDATDIHGYTDSDVAGAPALPEVWERFRRFAGSDILVAHNGQQFDVPVLRRACQGFAGLDDLVFYDTVPLARSLISGSVRLETLAAKFNVDVGRVHHAFDDALMLAGVVPRLNQLRIRRARTIAAVNLLDHLGLALALEASPARDEEDELFRRIALPYTLGRYTDCLDAYAAEVAAGAPDAPPLDEVIERLGGPGLMERIRTERSPAERYPLAVERLQGLVQSSQGDTVAQQIDQLLCRVALSTSAEVEIDPNRVNLLTLHSTKGLEFSRVYIVGVENQQLPGWKAIQEDRLEEIQEARRLVYVGMTRAKDRLVLTRAEQRFGYPSGGQLFLLEAGLAGENLGTAPALGVPVVPA